MNKKRVVSSGKAGFAAFSGALAVVAGAALLAGCGAGAEETSASAGSGVSADSPREQDASASSRLLDEAMRPALERFKLQASDLELKRSHVDANGARHLRLAQKHLGLDVVGGELLVHVDAKGTLESVNGSARGELDQLGQGGISREAAEATVMGDARFSDLRIESSRLVYIVTDDGAAHQAYESDVRGSRDELPVVDKVYTDVDSGAIVAVYPQIHTAKSRAIYSVNHGTLLPGAFKRGEDGPATGDVDVDDVFDMSGDTYDAYKLFFNRDSFNDLGSTWPAAAHYGVNQCNSFWDGAYAAFGDGDGTAGCKPLSRARDIVAHELTHAVTQSESGLNFSGESGGINESISDIFGAFVETWVKGGKTWSLPVDDDTWRVGQDAIAGGLRNMCDPASDGASPDLWYSHLGDLDVHYSSGVGNLAFCLLTKGGTHPRGKTDVVVPSIGMSDAIRILYKAQTDYLTSTANYAALRTAMEQAAKSLGYNSSTVTAVSLAYAAVGVGGPPPGWEDGLPNGVQLGRLAGAAGSDTFFKMRVPTNQASLKVTTSGGGGNVDLYLQPGAHPTLLSSFCKSTGPGTAEACTVQNPTAGSWYIMLHGAAAYSDVLLSATYADRDTFLTNGVAVTGLSGGTDSEQYFRVTTPAGKNLSVKITGTTGDADLYVQPGLRPTLGTFACRPYLNGSNETCTIASTQAGDYYIMIRGYASYSGLSLKASY